MFIAPSSGHMSLNSNMPFKLILRRFEVVSDVWSENAALFERLMEIHSNPPILYYGFLKQTKKTKENLGFISNAKSHLQKNFHGDLEGLHTGKKLSFD